MKGVGAGTTTTPAARTALFSTELRLSHFKLGGPFDASSEAQVLLFASNAASLLSTYATHGETIMTEATGGLKRKRTTQPTQSNRRRKTGHAPDARVISTQTTGKAFSKGGIDVDKFVRAREYEIKALEESLKRSKQALNARAFQSVPRDLRRRTASHNAKRVPKRLRERAIKEVSRSVSLTRQIF